MYAYNYKNESRELWDYLERQRVVCNGSWMVLRNFNLVCDMKDRRGGNPVTLYEVLEFKDCVEDCDFIELPDHTIHILRMTSKVSLK